jgi:hypothetical protein
MWKRPLFGLLYFSSFCQALECTAARVIYLQGRTGKSAQRSVVLLLVTNYWWQRCTYTSHPSKRKSLWEQCCPASLLGRFLNVSWESPRIAYVLHSRQWATLHTRICYILYLMCKTFRFYTLRAWSLPAVPNTFSDLWPRCQCVVLSLLRWKDTILALEAIQI